VFGDDVITNVNRFQQLWRDSANAPFTALVDAGFAWLLANPLPARDIRRIVHADVGAHNILVRDGHLAALLDWELTHIGDPAQDLAFVRTLLIEPLVPWKQFVAAYLAAGGPPEACDARAVDWFSVWNHVRNSVYTGIIFQKVRDGALRDVSYVAAAWDYTARLQRYLAKDLDRVL
jgi:aminoglycoside phosphotransferase (APT) family kinase protein